ncbi:MAG: class I SAM-dependent methyltransferase [Candidatus Binatia bacterium]
MPWHSPVSTRSRVADASGVTGPAPRLQGAATHTLPVDRWLLRRFLRAAGRPPVRCELPDRQAVYVGEGAPVGTLRFLDRGALYRLLWEPEVGFGEGYTDGRIVVDGDLVEVLTAIYRQPLSPWVERLLFRTRPPRRNSLSGARHNIHRHYDLGNDFYRLWLDEQMLYTCAYYPTPEATLEEAQIAKMHHVCRKLDLRPGERVVEAGCGWGSLALHMARHYGVRVRAFNISGEQIAYGRAQAARQGLADRVEFVEDDYRSISGTYDAVMSVGMLEHVGPDHYGALGRIIDRCLPAHGRGLIHTIGRTRPMRLNPWIEKHIFPGGYPPTLKEMMAIFEPVRLSVVDVENLRLHYERTAAAWLQRFEQRVAEVQRRFDERFVRAWRLYLAGTTVAFRTSLLQLFQVVFARERHNGLPWTRAHVYAER